MKFGLKQLGGSLTSRSGSADSSASRPSSGRRIMAASGAMISTRLSFSGVLHVKSQGLADLVQRICCLVIAPTFFSAANYVLLGQ